LENLRPFDAQLNNSKSAKVYLPEGIEDENYLIDCTLDEFKSLVKNWNP
jgi:hypothetical protein